MEAFIISTVAVGIAEIGDKSMLLAILLTIRYHRPWPVFWGLTVGVTANLSLATMLGIWLASWLDGDWLQWALGGIFLLVAVWALIPEHKNAAPTPPATSNSIFITAALGFFLLEMADKTQIAAMALAANFGTLLPVLGGSVLGVILVNSPAIWLGHRFAHHLPLRTMRLAAAALFAAIGAWILLDAAINSTATTSSEPAATSHETARPGQDTIFIQEQRLMIIGIPKEIKTNEYRVAATPAAVAEICAHGHEVLVEQQAGIGAGFSDADYASAGARLLSQAKDVFASAELIIKVKEPQAAEYALLHQGQVLFTYLHLAADASLTQALLDSGATCIAYETVTDDSGGLPLLAPMSQIAGRLATQAGATQLEKHLGGHGLLLSGATGVPPATVTVIGGGVVGSNAVQIALGMGARVWVLDKSLPQLERLSQRFGPALTTCYASAESTRQAVIAADLVIGAVLAAGRSASRVISADMVRQMRAGSVIVDVAIDQGGCCENSRPTTHAAPTFVVDDVVHYCVGNMPGAVPATASQALCHATLPFVLTLANQGVDAALATDLHLMNGLNIRDGKITHAGVAESMAGRL